MIDFIAIFPRNYLTQQKLAIFKLRSQGNENLFSVKFSEPTGLTWKGRLACEI